MEGIGSSSKTAVTKSWQIYQLLGNVQGAMYLSSMAVERHPDKHRLYHSADVTFSTLMIAIVLPLGNWSDALSSKADLVSTVANLITKLTRCCATSAW